MRTIWAALAAAVAGVLLGMAGAVGAGVTDPDTIVRVEGDAANGFGIHRHDGSATYPPTDSEARAECGEYDRFRDRVRCRTEVRVWYRDLAELQRSLEWALAR
ncbi:MAG TPA: hypothetical protein VD814_07975 [Nocardioides sp.]|nr:hypothetical protein [Nocardioides sp.]